MNDHCSIPHPLKREGTYQWQRMPEGLKEGFFKPDDRSLEQMVMQVARYASFVKYYDVNMNEWGNWEEFFNWLYDYESKKLKIANIDSLMEKGDVPPHLGLMLSFLKTFQATKEELNKFTNHHLNFYYGEVLQLNKKTAVADKVALLLEPEKNTVQARVEEGREMNAGKDATGKDLVYKTTREIVVNKIAIEKKKSIYADKTGGPVKALHISTDAATDNKFTQNNISSWYPFGDIENAKADIGFAFSSPVLFAKEGRRRLSIEIDGAATLPRAALAAYFTGPKGWIEAKVDLSPGVEFQSSATSKKYLLIEINESLPAIAAYNEKTHQSGFSFSYPVIKILVKNDGHFTEAYQFFTTLNRSGFKKIVMNVEGVKSFTITGENGKLNPLQAFKPFGNNPVKYKSFFTIGCSEAFNKYLKTFHLAANWKGAPGNMVKYYLPYDDYLINRLGESKAGTISVRGTDGKKAEAKYTAFGKQFTEFDQGNVPGKLELLSGGKWIPVSEDSPNNYTKRKPGTYNTFHATGVIKDQFITGNSEDPETTSKWGFARVTLQYDFGHHFFPSVLTDVVTQNALGTVATIKAVPPQPYTPEFNSLHLDYVLEDSLDISKAEHSFLQLHPFGFAPMDAASDPVIMSDYDKQGQLYIGLSGCHSPQTVNFFIARLDGTEDIDSIINEKIEWHYLAGNDWKKFTFDQVIVDTTNDFTSSGFISFSIPIEAMKKNELMGEDLVWLKAISNTSANAYPSFLDIHLNAVEAKFEDRGNDPYHLQSPLPAGTIAKPIVKIDGIKKVSQPYASYDNNMAEQDEHFFTRVSERLRHKDRSWSIWDYEHLALERFPSIYKLKAVSHATQRDMFAPGNVLCVALPSLTNIAEKDLLQPRLSKGVLTAAANYVKQFMTPFAKLEFINPLYEVITIACSVKIRPGFDETFYQAQLNKDLQQFIAPWITNRNVSPSFGGRIYASAIINFMEELPYIDYLTQFSATKLEDSAIIPWTEFTTGSSEDVILTSAAQHQIDTNAIC